MMSAMTGQYSYKDVLVMTMNSFRSCSALFGCGCSVPTRTFFSKRHRHTDTFGREFAYDDGHNKHDRDGRESAPGAAAAAPRRVSFVSPDSARWVAAPAAGRLLF